MSDIIRNLGTIVERQTQDIRRDCTLTLENSMGDFHLLDVSPQVLTDGFRQLIEKSGVTPETLIKLFGEETMQMLDLISE